MSPSSYKLEDDIADLNRKLRKLEKLCEAFEVATAPLSQVKFTYADGVSTEHRLPLTRAYETDSGIDLRALNNGHVTAGYFPTIIDTGICVEIPPGYEAQIRARSGLAAMEGIMVVNSPATIDSSFRGTLKVILARTVFDSQWSDTWHFEAGERIAQLVICKVELPTFELVDKLSDSPRGKSGLGSSGQT